jgi:hypothetical protein
MSYLRFAAMIVASTVAMFGLMYLNTYALDHVFWSETRAWMALVMGSTMAVLAGAIAGDRRRRNHRIAGARDRRDEGPRGRTRGSPRT